MENNYNLLDKVTISISARINNIDSEIKKGDVFYGTISNASKETISEVFGVNKETLEGLEHISSLYNHIKNGVWYHVVKIGIISLSHWEGSTNINTLCKYINLVDTRNTVRKNKQYLVKNYPRLEEFRIDALDTHISTLTESIKVIIGKINKGK